MFDFLAHLHSLERLPLWTHVDDINRSQTISPRHQDVSRFSKQSRWDGTLEISHCRGTAEGKGDRTGKGGATKHSCSDISNTKISMIGSILDSVILRSTMSTGVC